MPRIVVEHVHGPARRAVTKGLEAANAPMLGKVEFRPLTITLREGTKIIGGVVGETFLGWLYVSALWVADDHSRQGYGRKIMQAAEKEARRRGVRGVYLDTLSFQAPDFYAKLGYREFGRLEDFPAGHNRRWLAKAL
jgi:GNAT superfamily N-acetyltransferase